jgi:hypothetical protein|tara:strand:+ start:827 stop:1540 length:714 start_codon:yes stop_codon:yes gene_type:complete
MAKLNVNTVYTTVLTILNKEQRGYLTPDEFGKVAAQVQLEIFEKFFEDYNQLLRMPKTDVEFASRIDHMREDFQIFEKNDDASAVTDNIYTQPIDLHRFGSAIYNRGLNSPAIEIISSRDYRKQILSPLTQPTTNFPIAQYKDDKLTVFPEVSTPLATDVTFNYIRKPVDPVWAFTIGGVGQYVYDSVNSVQFEIDESNQPQVVLEILKYTGVIIRDPQIMQAAGQQLASDEANKKR